MQTENTTPRALTMSAIRAALPTYFAANVPALVQSISDKGARIVALSQALTGCALERAQSGNMPKAWIDTLKAGEALKGGAKTRVLAALDVVGAVKPASEKHSEISHYETFAQTISEAITAALTPAPTVKKATEKTDYKALYEQAQAECATMQKTIEALRALLATNNVAVPENV